MNTLQAQTAYVGGTEIKQVRLGSELVLAPNGDALWYKANELPSLDLRFAENKSLVDATTGQNLVTFTRASSGTYVGSDGLIKTAVTNLLLQSEGFNEAAWLKNQVTIDPNLAIAPNGTTTADKATASGTDAYLQQYPIVGVASGAILTASVWIKGEGSSIGKQGFIAVATNSGLGTTSTFTVTANWQRVSATRVTPVGDANGGVRIDFADPSVTGDIVYLWGAQLEQSTTVGEYVKTTSTINSAPRFDHDPTTGESLGLLVEESRTNLVLQSNQFDTTWTNTNSSETSASGTAPDGTNTAWELKDTVDGASVAHNLLQTVSFTSGVTYTISCWFKKGTLSGAGLGLPSSAFTSTTVSRFNLDTGTVASAGSGTINTITAFPNGWYRCSMSLAATATTTGSVQVRISTTDSNNYQGAGTGTILIWGAQLEAGSFPTSYIPTTTATVTRAADVASISGSNFSSWYRQDEGTVFADAPGIYNTAAVFTFSDGTNNNRILLDHGTNTRRCRIVSDGADQASLTSSYTYGSPIKSAVAYILDNSASANNGSLTANSPDTSCTMPTAIARLNIGSNAGSGAQAGTFIRRLTYWPTRLPNETLQTITQ